MGRAKIKRGSTNIDMTAMCDVAFLLLSFFILTTKFKPAEAVTVVTPLSVSNTHAVQKDAFTVSIDKEGRVFIDLTDEMKGDVIDRINVDRSLNLTPQDKDLFKKATFVGAPFNQLSSFLRLSPEDLMKVHLTGIPADSANNELQAWINAAVNVYSNRKIYFFIKGDNDSKYTAFKNVIEAFKKNDIYKYQLITSPAGVPVGSELEKANNEKLRTGTK